MKRVHSKGASLIPLLQRLAILALSLVLVACAKQPPANINNACDFLKERKEWYQSINEAQDRWNIPRATILAFIRQESSFKSDAEPPTVMLLGFIPWGNVTSAYGYSQALDAVWEEYKEATDRVLARRSSFRDSADFIGWYNHLSVRELRLSNKDAYNLYLAYHEGRGGFKRKSYMKKRWLLKVAKKVQRNARQYDRQIRRCAKQLKEPPWYDIRRFFWSI